jgi:hypothetical protein
MAPSRVQVANLVPSPPLMDFQHAFHAPQAR